MRKNKILIVDDSIDTVELLKKRLCFEGYETVEAYDGQECLQRVAEDKPDLIILDVMMPEMDGYEVCRRLKASKSTAYIPILMLTAKGDLEDKIKGLNVGAHDYLAKPFNFSELSARVKSLLTIKAARDRLVEEERTEAFDQMMDEVAHEIRNPLTSIGGFARRVYENLAEDDPNKGYVGIIIQEVGRLESMVKELVEVKTAFISYKEPSNINDLILEALEPYRERCGREGISTKMELSEQLPVLPVDREHMKAAFKNLIENSIEAMQNTSQKILTVASKIVDERLEIQICDTGKGIPKDKIKNIFDPFFTSKTIGPGLGLTFALRIIQEHRGAISVESAPGEGSAFTVTLPVRRAYP
jgi:two-component system, sensor histidine kinase and response regulator